jgi:hypothetical protein
MAFIELTGVADFPFAFNVDRGVGPGLGGSYRRDDIMLVQYLLKKVWEQNFFVAADPPLDRPPAPGSIKPDGIYGPITQRWILEYQKMMKKRANIRVDGRVDRKVGRETPIFHAFFTIAFLNRQFHDAAPDTFLNFIDDPDCPPELKAVLGVVITPGDDT